MLRLEALALFLCSCSLIEGVAYHANICSVASLEAPDYVLINDMTDLYNISMKNPLKCSLWRPDQKATIFPQQFWISDCIHLFGLLEIRDVSFFFCYHVVCWLRGKQVAYYLTVFRHPFFFWTSSFTTAPTKCARAALAGSFAKFWNSDTAVSSCIRLDSHAVWNLCRNGNLLIGSDGIITTDFICTSVLLGLFTIF